MVYLWKQINNENFNFVEFHIIKTEEAPYNRFTMTAKGREKKIQNLLKKEILDILQIYYI